MFAVTFGGHLHSHRASPTGGNLHSSHMAQITAVHLQAFWSDPDNLGHVAQVWLMGHMHWAGHSASSLGWRLALNVTPTLNIRCVLEARNVLPIV